MDGTHGDMTRPVVDAARLYAELHAAVPGLDLLTGAGVADYGKDEGYARRGRSYAPDVVARPTTTEEVAALVRFAGERGVPVVPWGSGTSLEGQGLAHRGGITVDLRGLDRVRRVMVADFQVEVDAGILYPELDRRLRREGLFLPPNPGAPATIGGMIANNSSGSKAVKYGVTRDYVARLEIVLADGTVTTVGNRARKSASGYDLRDLIVGSEGTLAIVTGAVLRLVPTPAASAGMIAFVPDVDRAAAVVAASIGSGYLPASFELLDERVAPVLAADSPLEEAPGAVLLIECDGTHRDTVAAELDGIAELVHDAGGRLQDADADAFTAVMQARKTIGWELVRRAGVKTLKLLDVAVPLSAYGTVVHAAYDVLDRHGLSGFVLGHAGDGNLHVLIASDSRDDRLWQRTLAAEEAIVDAALQAEGTITGEHGIGLAKRHLLRREHGAAVDLMVAVKRALDPADILNPGKVLPDTALDAAGAQP